MFQHTDTDQAPWVVVKSNDKKRGRIEAMRYVLDRFDYDDKDRQVVGTPDPRIVGSPDEVYDEDQLTDQPQNSSKGLAGCAGAWAPWARGLEGVIVDALRIIEAGLKQCDDEAGRPGAGGSRVAGPRRPEAARRAGLEDVENVFPVQQAWDDGAKAGMLSRPAPSHR